jgi:prepilin-type processing-associated H-X9-DG protein
MSDIRSDPSTRPAVDYGTLPPRRRRRLALSIAFAGFIALAMLTFAMRPTLITTRPTANRPRCASNLYQIGLAILLYQQDFGGRYPDTLRRLTETEQIGAAVFVCPQSNDETSTGSTTGAISDDVTAGPAGHRCSYVYVGAGLTDKTVKDPTFVAYEPLTNHDGDGSNVLYGDGHVDWETGADLAKLLGTTQPAR